MSPLEALFFVFVVVAGMSAVAAWGGVMIGAPEVAFRLQNILSVRDVELTFFGVFSFWIGGAVFVIGAAIGTVFVLTPDVDAFLALVAATPVIGVGIWSVRYSKRRWGESHEIFDHY